MRVYGAVILLFPLLLSLCNCLRFSVPADPEQGNQCRRIDISDVTQELLKPYISEERLDPVIITGILDSESFAARGLWYSRFEQENVFKTVGDVNVTPEDLATHGFIHPSENISIKSYMNKFGREQPLYFTSRHPSVRMLIPSIASMPPRYANLVRKLPFVSFGELGTFHHIHRHVHTLTVQVAGSKGWVLAPRDAYPEFAIHRRWHVNHAALHEEVCNAFSAASDSKLRYLHNGTHFCVTKRGEGLLFPNKMFHGTCGLDSWNFEVVSHAFLMQQEQV